MEAMVNGKKVVFKDGVSVRARQFRDIANAEKTLDYEQVAKALQPFVESWEFDGDPADPEAWGDLDIFEELMGINRAFAELLVEKAKNSAKRPITA